MISSFNKMRQYANDRELTITGNIRNDPTKGANCEILTGSSINPIWYCWKKNTNVRTRNLIMSLKSPPSASRRPRARYNNACLGRVVPSAFLAISVLCVWSLLTIALVNYRFIVANSTTTIGGSTRDWLDELRLDFRGMSSSFAHFTFPSSFVEQEALPKIMTPRILQGRAKLAAERADFGGLDIDPLPQHEAKRRIRKDTRLTMIEFRDQDANRDDSKMFYIADDDYSKQNHRSVGGNDDDDKGVGCRFVSDYHLNFQNCNIFHEISLEQSNLKYLG
jgi:hypothetical protein